MSKTVFDINREIHGVRPHRDSPAVPDWVASQRAAMQAQYQQVGDIHMQAWPAPDRLTELEAIRIFDSIVHLDKIGNPSAALVAVRSVLATVLDAAGYRMFVDKSGRLALRLSKEKT